MLPRQVDFIKSPSLCPCLFAGLGLVSTMEVDMHEHPQDWQFREVCLSSSAHPMRPDQQLTRGVQDPTAVISICLCLPLWTYRARSYVVQSEEIDESCPATAFLSLLWPCALGSCSYTIFGPI